MVATHDITKGNFGTDELTVRGCGKRAAATAFFLGNTRLPIGHVIAHRPLPFLVGKPEILAFLIESLRPLLFGQEGFAFVWRL